MTRSLLWTLPALTFLCASLAAQDVKPGVHAGLAIPVGDLADVVDSRLGITGGVHVGIYYGGGHELRPRLDLTRYEGGWHPIGAGSFTKHTITAFGLGADYLYYTDVRPAGFYLLMGLGNQWWQVNPDHGPSESNSSLYLNAGAGFRPSTGPLAYEIRFATGQFRSHDGQATQIQGVVSYRF